MSIRDRLLNVARAELKSAGKKIGSLFEGTDPDDHVIEEELKRMDREQTKSAPREKASSAGAKGSAPGEPAHIRRYYANLELPIGAPLAEVKASYRRLMRRYHPDLHQADREKIEVATRLSQELRVAYDGLVAYLDPSRG